jgi:exopolyphosphatase/guanosine-5'-triphosphate,3'-diphosphate pyrophosphatase
LEASVASRRDGYDGGSGNFRSPTPVLAALDLGTNNCRLLIARANGRGYRIIDAFSRIVRLGEGLTRNGALTEDAMRRTIEALKVCAGKISRRGVTHGRSVATEACRRASNCDEFLGRVRAETGLNIEIISTAEEAQLAFRGCAPLLSPRQPRALVFDIGGGSTEIGWLRLRNGSPPELIDSVSIPVGVVTLSEHYGSSQMSADMYGRMVGEVSAHVAPFAARNGIGPRVAVEGVQMLGTSGTVTTLAGIHLGLARYDRSMVDGTYLDFDTIRGISRGLADMTYEDRCRYSCIGVDRADLVVAGCAILEAICDLWPVGRLRVADRGVREGILDGLMTSANRRRSRRRRRAGAEAAI